MDHKRNALILMMDVLELDQDTVRDVVNYANRHKFPLYDRYKFPLYDGTYNFTKASIGVALDIGNSDPFSCDQLTRDLVNLYANT